MLIWTSSLHILDLVLSMDYAFFFLRFCILTYYNNWKSRPIILNGNKSKINQKTQSIANSYEYEELSLTTTKFANVVPHRLKNDAIFWNDYLYLEALWNMNHSLASPANLEFLTSIFLRNFLRFNAFLHSFKLFSRQKVRIYYLDPEDVDNGILFLSAHLANAVWSVQNQFLATSALSKKYLTTKQTKVFNLIQKYPPTENRMVVPSILSLN
jgi:hypothetical protein